MTDEQFVHGIRLEAKMSPTRSDVFKFGHFFSVTNFAQRFKTRRRAFDSPESQRRTVIDL